MDEQTLDKLIKEYSKYLLKNGDYSKKYKVKDKEELMFIVRNVDVNANLNWLDVSNVTDMSNLFRITNFNGDIRYWDVSNVTDMSYMFAYSSFNGDISLWDVSNVKNMSYMFHNSNFNQNISAWNVSGVRDMEGMFSCSFFTDNMYNFNNTNVSNISNVNKNFNNNQNKLKTQNNNNNVKNNFNVSPSKYQISQVNNTHQINKTHNVDKNFNKSIFSKDISNWKLNAYVNIKSLFGDFNTATNKQKIILLFFNLFNNYGDLGDYDFLVSNPQYRIEVFKRLPELEIPYRFYTQGLSNKIRIDNLNNFCI